MLWWSRNKKEENECDEIKAHCGVKFHAPTKYLEEVENKIKIDTAAKEEARAKLNALIEKDKDYIKFCIKKALELSSKDVNFGYVLWDLPLFDKYIDEKSGISIYQYYTSSTLGKLYEEVHSEYLKEKSDKIVNEWKIHIRQKKREAKHGK